jgi:yjeF C-terminal region, hydroxyethylthiazole kinase-related
MQIVNFSFADAITALPVRDERGNKGTFGTLTAICGCAFYRGAARLAISSALRCGVGIVRLAAPECVVAACAATLNECVYLPLPEVAGKALPDSSLADIVAAANRSAALLAGCGLGDTDTARSIVKSVAENVVCPVLLDADALNCLHGNLSSLVNLRGRLVITPHIGEFSRLSGLSIPELKTHPAEYAKAFADEYGCVVVLKDYITHIVSSDHPEAIRCGEPNSGLAKGGSGDVLAGMIASFMAQGTEPVKAAEIGCALHAEAATRCCIRLSARAMLPSDLLDELPYLFV